MTSLRLRILGVLTLLLCVVGAASFVASSALMDRSLAAFEERAAVDQFLRVDLGLRQEVDALMRTVLDYGVWDDSALHLQHAKPQFLKDIFTIDALRNLEVDYVAFGDVSSWLTSPVFELRHARSSEGEAAIEQAKAVQLRGDGRPNEIASIHAKLVKHIAADDRFWPRWIAFAERFGVVI